MPAKGTTKNKGQKDALDRFYTNPDTACLLVKQLLAEHPELIGKTFVEPSAGDGAFVYALEVAGIESIVAMDIAPAEDLLCKTEIFRGDFLSDDGLEKAFASAGGAIPPHEEIVFIGNPPFGEGGALSLGFIATALKYGHLACFVLSPAFSKENFQRKLGVSPIKITEIDNTRYRMSGGEIDVPSAFFLFDTEHAFEPFPDMSPYLPFRPIQGAETPDFGIRRNGGRAGFATRNWQEEKLTRNNGFLYKELEGCPENICDIINGCVFPERDWSVGPRSLSQKEIAKGVYAKMRELGLIDKQQM